jgi:hypothetical protein
MKKLRWWCFVSQPHRFANAKNLESNNFKKNNFCRLYCSIGSDKQYMSHVYKNNFRYIFRIKQFNWH